MTIPLSEEERVSPETQREPPIVATSVCDSAMLANSVRALAMDAVQAANSGHRGMPMGMAEIAVALWTRHLRHNPADPHWADRDRFVLSNGHGSMLQYALLHLSGYALPIDEIKHFRQLNSMTPGHPEVGVTPGVETTTGPLGQGSPTPWGWRSPKGCSPHSSISPVTKLSTIGPMYSSATAA